MGKKTGKMLRAEIDTSYETKRKAELAEYGGFEKYEVEGWSDTLQKAAEVMSDPKKMKAVAKCLSKKEAAFSKVKELTGGKGKPAPQDRDDY